MKIKRSKLVKFILTLSLYGKESISKIGNLRKNIRENKNNKENVIAEI